MSTFNTMLPFSTYSNLGRITKYKSIQQFWVLVSTKNLYHLGSRNDSRCFTPKNPTSLATEINLLQVRSAGSSELKIFSLASGRLYVSFLLRFRTGWGVGVGGRFRRFLDFLLVMALVMVGGTYLVDFLSILKLLSLKLQGKGRKEIVIRPTMHHS